MNWLRILKGKISVHHCHYHKWSTIGFSRYWSGRLFYIDFSKWSFHIDCRANWIEDMVTGTAK